MGMWWEDAMIFKNSIDYWINFNDRDNWTNLGVVALVLASLTKLKLSKCNIKRY